MRIFASPPSRGRACFTRHGRGVLAAIVGLALVLPCVVAMAADYPVPKDSDWIARDFKFHTGEVRRMMLETIRNDSEYNNGNYTTRPRFMKIASVFFGIASAGGTMRYQKLAPAREKVDKLVDERLAAAIPAGANDFLWQWGSSADYDTAPGLEKIGAEVLAINAADDERNPPETGIMEQAMKRVKNGRLYLIPASEETTGHLTTGNANFYARQLREFLQPAPARAM